MDLLSSLQQLSAHLNKLEERTFTDNTLFDADKQNLSDSLLQSKVNDSFLDNPIVTKFILQLQHLIESSPTNPKAFYHVLMILDQLSQHSRFRKHLQERNIVPLLANVLLFEETKPYMEMVLKILNKLTRNLKINWPEFYLTTLIPFLVDAIDPNDRDSTSHLCLSILVNISESRAGIDFLLKFCSSKEVTTKIQSYGFLSLKMHHLIDFFYKNTNNLTHTIFAIFEEISKSICDDDAFMCEECFRIVEEVAGSALEVCADTFVSHLNDLLDTLNDALVVEKNREDVVICGLRLFTNLIKSHDSLTSFHKKLLTFALKCYGKSDTLEVDALVLVHTLGERNIHVAAEEEDQLKGMWIKIVECLKKDDNTEKLLATLRVLNVFVRNVKHQEFILKTVNRTILHKIMEFDENPDKIEDEKILVILTALNVMATFEAVEPQDWYGCVDGVLKTSEMRDIIAQGFLRNNPDIFGCCLDLIKHTNFPSKEISTTLYGPSGALLNKSHHVPVEETISPIRVLQKQSSQIDGLIKQFTAAPEQMTESSAAVFVEYQDIYSSAKNQFYKQQIEEGTKQIAALGNLVNVLEAERRYTRSLLCKYKMDNEKACNEINRCEGVIEEHEKSLIQFSSKIEDLTKLNKEIEMNLKRKNDAYIQLQEEMEKYVIESKAKNKELKEMINTLEDEKKQEQKKNTMSQKVIDDMKKEANKRITRIQHLEDKVKEAESIKQKIHNLMNGI